MDTQSRRGDILCLLAILALATLFLAPALRPGYTLLPLGLESGIAPWDEQVDQEVQNPLLSDPFYTFYPRRQFFTASLWQGVYPLWNPYVFSGHPVVGDTAAQTFYPPNGVAAMFLSAARALPMLAWFHLIVTGAAMFAFLRSLRLQPASALLGAIVWMLNGSGVVWLENAHRLSTLCWMPVVFLFYELALQRRRLWPGVVAGLFYGLSILGGHTQFALGIGLALFAYALFRVTIVSRSMQRLAMRPLTTVVMVGLLGIGIGVIQLLPTVQLAGMSHRGAMRAEGFLSSGLPLRHVIGLWIPDFYGNPVRFSYWGDRNFAEVTAYYGAFVFPFSLAALVWTRRAEGRFFGLTQVLILLIALGTPLAWLVAWLPWTRYFRLISLIAYLPFFGAAAAAFGLQAVAAAPGRAWRVWAVYLIVLVLLAGVTALIASDHAEKISPVWHEVRGSLLRTGLLWLAGAAGLLLIRWRPTAGVVFLVTLAAVDLIQWGMPFNPVNSLDILYPENEVTARLGEDPSLYRVLPLQIERLVFGPNLLSVFGLPETGGYSSLMVEPYRQLVKSIDDQVDVWWMRPNQNILANSRFDPLFSLLNVKYVLAPDSLDQSLVSVEASFPGCAEPGLPLRVGERITQTFQAHHAGLNRVDIEFVRENSQPQPVRFLLWRDGEEGPLVADITVEGDGLQEHGVLTFYFAPVSDSAGQVFTWGVETEGQGQVTVCRARDRQEQPAFEAYSVQLQLADVLQGVWIYTNPNVLPRAYIVHKAEVVPHSMLLDRLVSPDFNAWTTALIEEPLLPEQAAALEAAPVRSNSTARIIDYGLHEIEVEAAMAAPGLLVLSDTYYPGWKVTVDGGPASLLRTNHALRGVYLPAGAHQVVFRFVPWMLYIGLIVAGLTLVCSAGVILWDTNRSGSTLF